MQYLTFDLVEVGDGISALEAIAFTPVEQHAAVISEVREVLDWAKSHYPDSHGPLDDGTDWDHDLQFLRESGGWHTVTLTLTATERFVDDFLAQVGDLEG